MNAYKHELKQFCSSQGCSSETREKGIDYLESVHAKVAGQRITGNALVPICAYLASQRLQNNEISREAAVKKSCLNRPQFDKEFETIRGLLPDDTARARKGRRMGEYDQLIKRHGVSRLKDLDRWLEEVEAEVSSGGRRRLDVGSVHGRCAIFFWVLGILENEPPDQQKFIIQNNLDHTNFAKLIAMLNRQCKGLEEKMQEEKARLPVPTMPFTLPSAPPTSPRKSPQKRPLRELPSRGSPKRPKLAEPASEEPASQSQLPVVPPTDDVEMLPPSLPPKTPSKRLGPFGDAKTPSSHQLLQLKARATGSESPSRRSQALHVRLDTPHTDHVTPSRRRSTRTDATRPQSPSRSLQTPEQSFAAELMDVDCPSDAPSSDEEEEVEVVEEEIPLPRRFRPVFRDRQQWYNSDPLLSEDWKRAKKASQRRTERYGHPFGASVQ
ncbi:hypothetical protein V5O48_000699 [Marasmius crinis-equi]|uniref:Uncharacterized protein n=1 Tax=Marasmius crinis-equi TaxID=585013 RepID=A0ABR3G161_9AGAR